VHWQAEAPVRVLASYFQCEVQAGALGFSKHNTSQPATTALTICKNIRILWMLYQRLIGL
jgi:hypothetical protein